MAENPPHSYTYPNAPDADSDREDVLRNKFGITSHKELRIEEYRHTDTRMQDLAMGEGPQGNFDKDHLKAIHQHIFQDVYEWAGHMRNERPFVDGAQVEAIGSLRKGGTQFLPGSRIDMGLNEAFKPLADLDRLRQSTPAEFSEVAGRVMADLNFVHPFREGNGRTQQAFIAELGRECGHEVDFTVITQGRMIEASIAVTHDPDNPAMCNMIEDATNPNRREALQLAIADLQRCGADPDDYYVCTARPGEQITGKILAHDERVASFVTGPRLVVVDAADLPERLPPQTEALTITAHSDFSGLAQAREFAGEIDWTGADQAPPSPAVEHPSNDDRPSRRAHEDDDYGFD